MIAVTPKAKKVWTDEELQALKDEGYRHEVVKGELLMSPKNNPYHGDICAELLTALRTYAKAHQLGVVWDSSTGFWMANRNCRAPDISFVSKARLIRLDFKRKAQKFFPGAPDLAVEILAPHNNRAEMDERLRDFFSSGTQITWLVNPQTELVEICYSLTRRRVLDVTASLDGEHLLPGFNFPIADLFRKWDWE